VALPELQIAADARGQRLELCNGASAEELSSSLDAAIKAGARGLTILETPLLLGLRRDIAGIAATLRLAAGYTNREAVGAAGVASYGVDRRQLYRRAAELVDKILKGQKPENIPVEQPTKFELVINLKTAKTIGLQIPDKMLALADEVIE